MLSSSPPAGISAAPESAQGPGAGQGEMADVPLSHASTGHVHADGAPSHTHSDHVELALLGDSKHAPSDAPAGSSEPHPHSHPHPHPHPHDPHLSLGGKDGIMETYRGPILAFASAALFGVSPAAAKAIVGEMGGAMLASLLYLGSGFALLGYMALKKQDMVGPLRTLSQPLKLKLGVAIVCGGILGPLCLAYGLQTATAFAAAVILNLESVTTTMFAYFFFKEHVGRVVIIGKGLLLLGGFVMSLDTSGKGGGVLSVGAALVALATVWWGIDNNATRDVEDLPPALLAGCKGAAAGTFNLFLALALGQRANSFWAVVAAMVIGAACYGASLVLFVEALRLIGASRTSTMFATGPFLGMAAAVIFLGERPAWWQWLATLVMAGGLYILLMEDHEHEHTHEEMEHGHRHYHDEHHQHAHDGTEGPEPHTHPHKHERLVHSHKHWPDIHHRHQHGNHARLESQAAQAP